MGPTKFPIDLQHPEGEETGEKLFTTVIAGGESFWRRFLESASRSWIRTLGSLFSEWFKNGHSAGTIDSCIKSHYVYIFTASLKRWNNPTICGEI
jgi:hypothetical protein